MQNATYVRGAVEAMKSRFSSFIVTPEQVEAWLVGFDWIHQYACSLLNANPRWKLLPEFAAPLISGRPDLVIDTGSHLLVVEMKTGHKPSKSVGEKQVIKYSDELWAKLKIGNFRIVVPIILSSRKSFEITKELSRYTKESRPEAILSLDLNSLISLSRKIFSEEDASRSFTGENKNLLKYSPRPTVVQAAISLVAGLHDKNIITGLADTKEIQRIIEVIRDKASMAQYENKHEIVVVSGAPGAGKTLVGLRVAHDRSIQELLPSGLGTPLYLTGNGPLVEVLVESLARDEVKQLGSKKSVSVSNANAKVRLVHSITEQKLGIESNVIVFDEGQRIWTEQRMQQKRRDKTLGSEAEEILKYLGKLPWSLAIVLIGAGQEINVGEEGIKTWIEAVLKQNKTQPNKWGITVPSELCSEGFIGDNLQVDDGLALRSNQRTDNAADVSNWVKHFLDADFDRALDIRKGFKEFPIVFTRSLITAKSWLKDRASPDNVRCGLVASSTSKRLTIYGVDALSSAERSFNWANWYLNELPDLNSSSALEVTASEYKCQGLELDLVGVCWSWDLVLHQQKWQARALKMDAAEWKTISHKALKSTFQLNAYRVLLTRARKGMVIWIPEGEERDTSRNPQEMNIVAGAFRKSGIEEI